MNYDDKPFNKLKPEEYDNYIKKKNRKFLGFLIIFAVCFGFVLYQFDFFLAILFLRVGGNEEDIVMSIFYFNMMILICFGWALNMINKNSLFTGALADKGTWNSLQGNTKWEYDAARGGAGMYHIADNIFDLSFESKRGKYIWIYRIIILVNILITIKIFKTF